MMIELVASSAWMAEGAAPPGRPAAPANGGAPGGPAAAAESMPRSTSASFVASACFR